MRRQLAPFGQGPPDLVGPVFEVYLPDVVPVHVVVVIVIVIVIVVVFVV
jgi:hypothetical protein